jgi:protease-4
MGLFARAPIALVELFGILGGTLKISQYLRLLQTLRDSRKIKAAILDIDSPGGTATASELLHYALLRVAAVKPVVAFIRGMGTSGAYLVSSAATKIIALPTALVGSIGVISIRPIMPELLQKIGIKVSVAKGGRLKDMGAFYREPTEEEKQKEQELVDEYYANFIANVAQSRRLDIEKVKEYATGEVFSARKAKELGLVDELGDLDKAIDLAAQLGRVPRKFFHLRPRRPLLERLLYPAATSLIETTILELERGSVYQIYYQ